MKTTGRAGATFTWHLVRACSWRQTRSLLSHLVGMASWLVLTQVLLVLVILFCFWTVLINRPRGARGLHPCSWQFVEVCRTEEARNAKLNIDVLDKKFPPPTKSTEFRHALTEHRKLQNKICNGELPLRLMVFTCKQPKCPALADGIRGITFVYVLAVLSRRAFLIHTPEWIPRSHFFPAAFPHEVNSCPAANACTGSPCVVEEISSNLVDYTMPKDPDCKNFDKFGFLTSSARVVSIVSNQVSECNYMLLRRAGFDVVERVHESVSKLVFNHLFSFPSRTIWRHVNDFLHNQSISLDKAVCIHVRSGAFQSRSDRVCLQRNIDDVWRCGRAMEMSTVGLSKEMNITWLVMGDSDFHLPMISSYFADCSASDALFVGDKKHRRLVSSDSIGRIEHVRDKRMISGGWREMYRVIFDLYLLSLCPYVVASYSGYSGLAVAISLDWSQKKFFRVDRRTVPTANMNEVCFQQMPY